MKDWDSKIVSVLSGTNVVIIKDQKDLEAFREICARIGLAAFDNDPRFGKLVAGVQRWNLQHGKHYSDKAVYYACYQNHKGFGFWQDEIQNLVDWYGIAPFSMKELLKEIK